MMIHHGRLAVVREEGLEPSRARFRAVSVRLDSPECGPGGGNRTLLGDFKDRLPP